MTDRELAEALKQLGWGEGSITQGIAQNFRCVYCKCDLLASVDAYATWTEDHIDPTSRGGDPKDINNIVIACRVCNIIKRAWTPSDLAPGASKADRVAKAKEYITDGRMRKVARLEDVLKSVRGWRDARPGGEGR